MDASSCTSDPRLNVPREMNQLVKDKAMDIITGFLKFSGISMSKMLFTKFP
jgi:hypothetical protein